MILEKIVAILGKEDGRRYVLRRLVRPASSIAKCYKTYVMELWEVKAAGNVMLWDIGVTGNYTEDWNKKALVEKAEEAFMQELFRHLESKQG